MNLTNQNIQCKLGGKNICLRTNILPQFTQQIIISILNNGQIVGLICHLYRKRHHAPQTFTSFDIAVRLYHCQSNSLLKTVLPVSPTSIIEKSMLMLSMVQELNRVSWLSVQNAMSLVRTTINTHQNVEILKTYVQQSQ